MSQAKIKVAEIFYSIQGEGLYTGIPSIFIRTFGCNFRCPGYSMPRGVKSTEYRSVNPDNYEKYEDLPLVHTGCDTYAAIYPEFKKFSPMRTTSEIAEKVRDLLDGQKFNQNVHLILTGGEPLLGWQRQYPFLLTEFSDLTHLTFETNGTQRLSAELQDYLSLSQIQEVTFSVSAKLPCSGETWENAIRPDVVRTYLGHNGYFKFVVADEQDVKDAQRAYDIFTSYGINWPVYLMPAGGTDIHYNGNMRSVAELAKQFGFRYSQRLQITLFGNEWGT